MTDKTKNTHVECNVLSSIIRMPRFIQLKLGAEVGAIKGRARRLIASLYSVMSYYQQWMDREMKVPGLLNYKDN